MKIYAETDRLILRELMPEDIDGMFELDSNPEVHKYLGKKPVKTKEEVFKNIENVRQQYITHKIGRWAAVEKASGEFIGWSGLKMNVEQPMNGHSNFYDVGYRLIPKYWGKGYATESGKAAVDYGFNKLDIDTIYGIAEVENKASRNALEKIGLQYITDFMYEPENLVLSWYEIKKSL